MSLLLEDQFERKLLALKDTQESISSLSAWCLERHQHHKRIISIWLQVLKKVEIEQRLILFYLANDVIQTSRQKGFDFEESWRKTLEKAVTMVRDDKVSHKIERLFWIWDERSIYDKAFLVDLTRLLSHRSEHDTQEIQDFQPLTLISKIKACKALEDDTDLKCRNVNDSHLPLNDMNALHSLLKDRGHGADLERELEEGVDKMVAYITALKAEIKVRDTLIDLLDLSDDFYDTQRKEAKIVFNAYKNFGKRVGNLKKNLDDLTTSLPSPVSSPDLIAPSFSPESDLDLPQDSTTGKDSTANSFIVTEEMLDHESLLDIYKFIRSPRDSPPPSKYNKPPTPPLSCKRKSSLKWQSPPLKNHVTSTTPTLYPSPNSTYSSPFQASTASSSYTGEGDSNDNDSPNAPCPLGSGFSSFMGNPNLPFDFQKGLLFSEGSREASPPPFTLEDSSPHMDNFLSDSDNDGELVSTQVK